MEKQETIVQIAIRVAQKLAEAGEKVSVEQVMQAMGLQEEPAELPGLLIVSKEHGCVCHEMYENSSIKEKYQICCALEHDYQVDLDNVEVVVLYQLTTEDMCKIASGITDTPYTKLVAKALLAGKAVYVPREEVELYQYPVGGLGSYQCMLQSQLTKLVSFGVKICDADKLECAVLGECAPAEAAEQNAVSCEAGAAETAEEVCEEAAEEVCEEEVLEVKEMTFNKRVITERDVIEANREKVQVIRITSKNILTPLAKDAASKRNIRLIKE